MEQEDMDSFRREHNRHDKEHSAKAARAKSRQTQHWSCCGLAATATANPREVKGTKNEVYYYQKEHPNPVPSPASALAQAQAGPRGIYVVFHVLGGG